VVYGRSARLDGFPVWLVVAGAVLSAELVGTAFVLYLRGELDESGTRRSPPR
jgi:hypothetical protein